MVQEGEPTSSHVHLRFSFQGDKNEEEDFYAISPSWYFDRQMRQWRRLASTTPANAPPCDGGDHQDVCSINSSSSSESEAGGASTGPSAAATPSTDDHETSRSSSRCSSNRTPSLDTSPGGPLLPEAEGPFPEKPPRRKGTSLLKKMETFRLREPTGLSRTGTPQAADPVLERDRPSR